MPSAPVPIRSLTARRRSSRPTGSGRHTSGTGALPAALGSSVTVTLMASGRFRRSWGMARGRRDISGFGRRPNVPQVQQQPPVEGGPVGAGVVFDVIGTLFSTERAVRCPVVVRRDRGLQTTSQDVRTGASPGGG